MADERSHLSWSFLLALLVGALVALYTRFDLELALLTAFLVMIGSVLPNIDSTDDGLTGEVSGLLCAFFPVLLFKFFPGLLGADPIRVALTVIIGYLLARFTFNYLASNVFVPRGALHSIPAILLFFEIGYVCFPGLIWKERVILGGGLAIGVASHIFLDAFTNINLVKKTLAKNAHSGRVLKFAGTTVLSTWVLYLSLIFFGWLVAKDMLPSLRMQAPVTTDK